MSNDNKKIWKVRTVKNYPQAHNHILLGEVLQMNQAWVRLRCRTFHFGSSTNGIRGVQIGENMERILPWNRIEIVNVLDSKFDYIKAELYCNESNQITLNDGNLQYSLIGTFETRL